MTPLDSLTAVRRSALQREEAEQHFRRAIFSASADGHSLRKIGAAAGVSHTRVLQIVRGETADVGEPYVEHLAEHERRWRDMKAEEREAARREAGFDV